MSNECVTSTVEFACPICCGPLTKVERGWQCPGCEKTYETAKLGYTNFLEGEGFADQDNVERALHEEKTAEVTMTGYLIPLLNELFPNAPSGSVRVLDVGSGVAKSVDLLRDAGYDAWGVDSGHRAMHWKRRKYPQNLVIANGQAMPFPDDTFDFIFSAGVLEHVGCDGDARSPSPGHEQARLDFVSGSVRVTRPGGMINYTGPNRLFPFDLFHRNTESNPFRFHWPWDPFLQSMKDFRYLFVEQCGCESLRALPIRGYWGFLRLNRTLTQRLGCKAANLYFNTIGSWPVLRGSFANPWLCVLVTK